MPDPKKRAQTAVAEIDLAELTCRLMEVGCKMHRLPGTSGRDGLRQIRQSADRCEISAQIVDDFEAMAEAAVHYLAECINNMKRLS